jgi:hypothetical protein
MIEGLPKFTSQDFDYYRAQGVQSKAANPADPKISQEARNIGYKSGIKELTFLAQRVIDLERRVAELENAKPRHLRNQETRAAAK